MSARRHTGGGTRARAAAALSALIATSALGYELGCADSANDCNLLGTCKGTGGAGGASSSSASNGGATSTSSTGGATGGGGQGGEDAGNQGGGGAGGGPDSGPPGPCRDGGTCDDLDPITNDTCVGLVCTHKPKVAWNKRYGDAADQSALFLAATQTGNLVITGGFNGSLNFGGGTVGGPGAAGLFYALLDASGTHVDSKGFTATILSSATNAVGITTIAGTFFGTVDFGGGALTSNGPAFFLAQYSGSGAHLWSQMFQSAQVDDAHVAVDSLGNTLVAGTFSAVPFSFAAATLPSNGGKEMFAAKFDTAGGHKWSKSFGGAGDDVVNAIAVSPTGAAFIAGTFTSTQLDLGTGGNALPGTGDDEILLARLDGNTGSAQWAKEFGAPLSGQKASRLAVGATGNLYLGAEFDVSLDFAGTVLTASGHDLALAKLDGQGTVAWAKGFGGAGTHTIEAIAIDSTENALLAGGFSGALDFGGGAPLGSVGSEDAFLAKITSTGAPVWSVAYGSAGSLCRATGVAANGMHVAIAGFFTGSIDFGTGALVSNGGSDVFLAKLGP